MVRKREWKQISVDVVIVGSGISGLWLSNMLHNKGFSTLVIEKYAMGDGQTLNAQGIIHNGTKYTLNGNLPKEANIISDMPRRWRNSIKGKSDINLSGIKILSEAQYLIANEGKHPDFSSFSNSDESENRVKNIDDKVSFPEVLQNDSFNGKVFKLEEFVIDVKSVLEKLSENTKTLQCKFKGDYIRWDEDFNTMGITIPNQYINITSQLILLAAGEGNDELIKSLPENIHLPETEVIPLHMVYMSSKDIPALYAHFLGEGTTPRLSVTTHSFKGKPIWYLGGHLAEVGAKMTSSELIQLAKKEVTTLMPWVDLKSSKWATHYINVARPVQRNLSIPDRAYTSLYKNLGIVWPISLSLLPNLEDQISEWIENKIKLEHKYSDSEIDLSGLESVELGDSCWESRII